MNIALAILTCIALCVHLANAVSVNKNVVAFHPITQEQYDAILSLTKGEHVITESRLLESGLTALRGLAANLRSGFSSGWLPGLFSNLIATREVVTLPDGYPLCVVQQSDDNFNANFEERSISEENSDSKGNRLSVVKCIVGVREPDTFESHENSQITRITTRLPQTHYSNYHGYNSYATTTTTARTTRAPTLKHSRNQNGVYNGFPQQTTAYNAQYTYPQQYYSQYYNQYANYSSLTSNYQLYPEQYKQSVQKKQTILNQRRKLRNPMPAIPKSTFKPRHTKQRPKPKPKPRPRPTPYPEKVIEEHPFEVLNYDYVEISSTPTTQRPNTNRDKQSNILNHRVNLKISNYPKESDYNSATYSQHNYQNQYPKLSYTSSYDYPSPAYVGESPHKIREPQSDESLESGDYLIVE